MPQDHIPNPMKKKEVKASHTDNTEKKESYLVVFGLDTSKITRMHNLYIDIRDNQGRIVCHTYVLPPRDIQAIQKLLKEAKRTLSLRFDGKEYVFKKKELAEAFSYLETEKKEETGGFGFCFSWGFSISLTS